MTKIKQNIETDNIKCTDVDHGDVFDYPGMVGRLRKWHYKKFNSPLPGRLLVEMKRFGKIMGIKRGSDFRLSSVFIDFFGRTKHEHDCPKCEFSGNFVPEPDRVVSLAHRKGKEISRRRNINRFISCPKCGYSVNAFDVTPFRNYRGDFRSMIPIWMLKERDYVLSLSDIISITGLTKANANKVWHYFGFSPKEEKDAFWSSIANGVESKRLRYKNFASLLEQFLTAAVNENGK